LVSRIASGRAACPSTLHDAMMMAATNPPVRKACVAGRIGLLQCAMGPPSNLSLVHVLCAASQARRTFTTGDSHAMFHPWPARPLNQHLPCRSTAKLSDLSLWTVIAPSPLHLLSVVCRTSHVFALLPPGTADALALHPHIRSRSQRRSQLSPCVTERIVGFVLIGAAPRLY
jgi:hypothetical protein